MSRILLINILEILLSAPLQHHQDETKILVLVEERVLVSTINIFTLQNHQKTTRHRKKVFGQGEGEKYLDCNITKNNEYLQVLRRE